MDKFIVPHIMSSNGDLDNIEKVILTGAIADVEQFFNSHYVIDRHIDVAFSRGFYRLAIVEDGIGGRCFTDSCIVIGFSQSDTPPRSIIAEMLCHEVAHATRWNLNDQYSGAFIYDAIFEGLAICIQEQFALDHSPSTTFLNVMHRRYQDEAFNARLIKGTRPVWHMDHFDHNALFYTGNKQLPRWAAYSLGYFIVKQAIEQSGKDIFTLLDANYEDIYDLGTKMLPG